MVPVLQTARVPAHRHRPRPSALHPKRLRVSSTVFSTAPVLVSLLEPGLDRCSSSSTSTSLLVVAIHIASNNCPRNNNSLSLRYWTCGSQPNSHIINDCLDSETHTLVLPKPTCCPKTPVPSASLTRGVKSGRQQIRNIVAFYQQLLDPFTRISRSIIHPFDPKTIILYA